MKFLKRVVIGLVLLVVLLVVVAAAFISLVDLNDYKDKIQNLTKSQTGRDLAITGDLSVSYFPWVGITLGELSLSNAEGFGDTPFARIDSANVKVELLPLLRKSVNVKKVELKGLSLDLQRAADGSTNWDDLSERNPSTTVTTEDNTTTEVEGDAAAIAALAVGGVEIDNANVSWLDQQGGTDARLTEFKLNTGRIELARPFNLETSFNLASDSAGVAATVAGSGDITIDLDSQRYSVANFKLNGKAEGETLPGGVVDLSLGSDLLADLTAQTVNADKLTLSVMGVTLRGELAVSDLDTEPQISAELGSDEFSPAELITRLGVEALETADKDMLSKASLNLSLAASPAAAQLNNLTIKLDDTTFEGAASLPDLSAAMPPVRFDFNVDDIDLDRYLPPVAEATEGDTSTAETTPAEGESAADTPIELPLELIRTLDVDGLFSVGKLKIMNLVTENIKVPLHAKGGVVSLNDIAASMYQGSLSSSMGLDATGDIPAYSFTAAMAKVESEPLLADLQQGDSPISGNAGFNADISTAGASVNALKAGLNGNFSAAFLDGSLNGINIGYQIRRAKATLLSKSLPEEEKELKTDFSSLTLSGQFADGVMTSTDLDMRSPLLRLAGAGTVDLVKEYVDYVPSIKITGTAEGQGGKDLEALKGVQLDAPVRGSFDDLAADFTGILLSGLKDNISGAAKAEAEKLKAEAKTKLKAKEAELKQQLEAEEAAAREKLAAEEAELKAKLEEEKARAKEKAKDKLREGLKGLLD